MWCEIRVQGHLDGAWSAWFDGLVVAKTEGGESVFTGKLPDQAALHGILVKVRDLGLPLVAVTCTEAERSDGLPSLPTGDLEGQ
jgi:hypothetical protein